MCIYPTVSVIIPTLNNSTGIERLTLSLKSQDYPNKFYEVLIVDNGSTDDTISIVRNNINNLNNFSLLTENEITGSYAARNKGVSMSSSTIIAFIDDDCNPLNNWISAGIKGLQLASKYCGGGRICFTFEKQKPNIHELFDSSLRLNQEYYVKELNFAATANFFIYRNIFLKVGKFNENYISSGDKEFGQRLKKNNEEIIYIPNSIVQHPARNTFKANIKKSIRLAVGYEQFNNSGNSIIMKYREGKDLYKNLALFELLKIVFLNIKFYISLIIKRFINLI